MTSKMRQRPAARLLVIDEEERVLLFKFVFAEGALAGSIFWATPGGALDPGESFEEAAKRELFEETGMVIDSVEEHVAEKQFVLPLPEGGEAFATERFYLVRTVNKPLSKDNWTELENQVMTEHKWWHKHELHATTDTVYPKDLTDILARVLGQKIS